MILIDQFILAPHNYWFYNHSNKPLPCVNKGALAVAGVMAELQKQQGNDLEDMDTEHARTGHANPADADTNTKAADLASRAAEAPAPPQAKT